MVSNYDHDIHYAFQCSLTFHIKQISLILLTSWASIFQDFSNFLFLSLIKIACYVNRNKGHCQKGTSPFLFASITIFNEQEGRCFLLLFRFSYLFNGRSSVCQLRGVYSLGKRSKLTFFFDLLFNKYFLICQIGNVFKIFLNLLNWKWFKNIS